MKKFYKTLIMVLCLFALVAPALADGERVVTIGGNQPYRELTDFYMFSNVVGTGKIFYVDSGVSSSGNGTSWSTAKSTLDAAVALCTANNGDVIMVAPGHAENLAAANAVDLDVAGITVIGLGDGQDKPEFTFTATAGEFVVGAASVTVTNVRFIPGISDVVMGISVEAAGDDFTLDSCEFMVPGTATFEFLDAIDIAALADRTTVKNCVYRDGATSATNHFIEAGNGVNVGLSVLGNDIQGRFAVSAVWSNQIDVGCIIQDNVIANTITAQHCIEFTTTASGMIVGNRLYGDTEASILDPGSMYVEDNFISTAIDLDATPRWALDKAIDHLAGVADGTGAYPASVVNDSILAMILAKGATATTSTYSNTTDSLEAIRDNMDTQNTADQVDLDAILADTSAADTSTELQTLAFGTATGGADILADTAAMDTSTELQTLAFGTATGGADILADTNAMDTNTELQTLAFGSATGGADILADTAAIQPGAPMSVSKTLTTIMSGDNPLFTVTGVVKVVEIVGIVTTGLEAKGCLINYNFEPTVGTPTVIGTDGTALEVNGDIAGTLYTWSGVLAADLVENTVGVALGLPTEAGVILPAGSLDLDAAVVTSATGTVAFHVRYVPVSPGATMVAQ